MATADGGASHHGPGRGRQVGGGHPSPRHHPSGPQDSPIHHSGAASSGPNTELSGSDASSWVLNGIKTDREGQLQFLVVIIVVLLSDN